MVAELADANVLLALHAPGHPYHARAARWLESVGSFATTPITEAALVRLLLRDDVMGGKPVTPGVAMAMLAVLKEQPHYAFWPDGQALDRSRFSYALQGPGQVTDIHLLDLAAARGAVMATFDARINAALRPRDRRFLHVLDVAP